MPSTLTGDAYERWAAENESVPADSEVVAAMEIIAAFTVMITLAPLTPSTPAAAAPVTVAPALYRYFHYHCLLTCRFALGGTDLWCGCVILFCNCLIIS